MTTNDRERTPVDGGEMRWRPSDITEGDAMRLFKDLRRAYQNIDEMRDVLLYFMGSKSLPPSPDQENAK